MKILKHYTTPQNSHSIWKMLVGRLFVPFGKSNFEGRTVSFGQIISWGGGELRLCYAILQDQDDHSRVLPNIVYFSWLIRCKGYSVDSLWSRVFFKHSFKMLQMKHIYNQITDAIRSRFSSSRIKNNLFSTFALNIGVSWHHECFPPFLTLTWNQITLVVCLFGHMYIYIYKYMSNLFRPHASRPMELFGTHPVVMIRCLSHDSRNRDSRL